VRYRETGRLAMAMAMVMVLTAADRHQALRGLLPGAAAYSHCRPILLKNSTQMRGEQRFNCTSQRASVTPIAFSATQRPSGTISMAVGPAERRTKYRRLL